jgi:hypothetical protein
VEAAAAPTFALVRELDMAPIRWEGVYGTTSPSGLSRYLREPTRSPRLIEARAADLSTPVLDVGAGTSALVDLLLERG